MATEYESEREALATILDLIIEVEELANEGKTSLEIDELKEFLISYAKRRKIHK